MRVLASVGAMMMLAACGNAVTSTGPLFSPGDARGQPQLRPGVWGFTSSTREPTCKVDTAQPVATWDGCGGGLVVRPGELLGGKPGEPVKVEDRTVLARGAPAVFQVIEVGESAPAAPRYEYVGVRPLKLDARGRVIELRAWEAMCGPPPPDDPDGSRGHLTAQLMAGLVADENQSNCLASARGPVRESVSKSESWSTQSGGAARQVYFQWFRDGEQ